MRKDKVEYSRDRVLILEILDRAGRWMTRDAVFASVNRKSGKGAISTTLFYLRETGKVESRVELDFKPSYRGQKQRTEYRITDRGKKTLNAIRAKRVPKAPAHT